MAAWIIVAALVQRLTLLHVRGRLEFLYEHIFVPVGRISKYTLLHWFDPMCWQVNKSSLDL